MTLAVAVIALLGSLWTLILGTRLAVSKERRQLLWTKELDRFFELEELAGSMVEGLSGYGPLPHNRDNMTAQFNRLEQSAGRFARYPEVRQAIRDLKNALDRVFAAKNNFESPSEVQRDAEAAYKALLKACDQVVGGKHGRHGAAK